MSDNENAVVKVQLTKLGEMLGGGLAFVGGDIPKAMGIVIDSHDGEEVVVQRAIAAIEADDEKGIEAEPAIPEQKVLVNEDNREAILGAIAGLPQLRSLFAEQVAEAINKAREGSESYATRVEKILELKKEIQEVTGEIFADDSEAVPGFNVKSFVIWMGEHEVVPKPAVTTIARGVRVRTATTVEWNLDFYQAKQSVVEGPEASFHNLLLERTATGWQARSDEGIICEAASPNKVKNAVLEMCGMSKARSANEFWQGSEQEKSARV